MKRRVKIWRIGRILRLVRRIVMLITAIGIISALGIPLLTSRADVVERNIVRYESVQIRYGDTLWDLAGKYVANPTPKAKKRWVKDVARLNGMGVHSTLVTGGWLCVFYEE